jgi:hypothetical protein
MEHILPIGIIVVVVIAAVHLVSVYQYKQGFRAGVNTGRQQVLTENISRTEQQRRELDTEMQVALAISPCRKGAS